MPEGTITTVMNCRLYNFRNLHQSGKSIKCYSESSNQLALNSALKKGSMETKSAKIRAQ
jgi:hypothetical protein